jgi:hypothetical protein
LIIHISLFLLGTNAIAQAVGTAIISPNVVELSEMVTEFMKWQP